MDLQRILSQLHEERRLVNEVILVLERLTQGLGGRSSLARARKALEPEFLGKNKEKPKARKKRAKKAQG